jgi:glutamate synthase domain-containing protein 2
MIDTALAFVREHPVLTGLLGLLAFLVLVALRDILQKKHTIKHNFPVVGNLRYLLEKVGPELRQYIVTNDKEEQPFNRDERRWVYSTAKGQNKNFGFGTSELLYGIGYPIIKHAAFPYPEAEATHPGDDPTAIPCLKIMGEAHGRARAWRPPSVINLSAMSFGSLGRNAVSALNKGAQLAGCYHNTGEGSVGRYHLFGADVVWQLGTGYFGARDRAGNFDLEMLAARCAEHGQIKAIEIKLSQGAKPGKGGILPGDKVSREIAEIRGVPVGKDVISPNAHSAFRSVDEMIDFIERIAARTGLPVGIKSAIGESRFWEELAARMRARPGEGPDFIAIDGGEGGTGAAPLTFADHVSLPFKVGFQRVYQTFQQAELTGDVVWIGSGKLGFPDRSVIAFAMGCDLISIAREAMLAIGCIQAQRCHTGHCPAGIATHNWWLQAGLDVDDKAARFARFIRGFRSELLQLAHTAGYQHPGQFDGDDIEFSTGVNRFSTLDQVLGYRKDPVRFTSMTDYGAV